MLDSCFQHNTQTSFTATIQEDAIKAINELIDATKLQHYRQNNFSRDLTSQNKKVPDSNYSTGALSFAAEIIENWFIRCCS